MGEAPDLWGWSGASVVSVGLWEAVWGVLGGLWGAGLLFAGDDAECSFFPEVFFGGAELVPVGRVGDACLGDLLADAVVEGFPGGLLFVGDVAFCSWGEGCWLGQGGGGLVGWGAFGVAWFDVSDGLAGFVYGVEGGAWVDAGWFVVAVVELVEADGGEFSCPFGEVESPVWFCGVDAGSLGFLEGFYCGASSCGVLEVGELGAGVVFTFWAWAFGCSAWAVLSVCGLVVFCLCCHGVYLSGVAWLVRNCFYSFYFTGRFIVFVEVEGVFGVRVTGCLVVVFWSVDVDVAVVGCGGGGGGVFVADALFCRLDAGPDDAGDDGEPDGGDDDGWEEVVCCAGYPDGEEGEGGQEEGVGDVQFSLLSGCFFGGELFWGVWGFGGVHVFSLGRFRGVLCCIYLSVGAGLAGMTEPHLMCRWGSVVWGVAGQRQAP